MATSPSTSDRQIFIALKAWLVEVLEIPTDTVIMGNNNRVPMPEKAFVLMRRITQKRLATTIEDYRETRATFTGSISGKILTTSAVVGEIVPEAALLYTGAPSDTTIVSSASPTTWNLSKTVGTVSARSMDTDLAEGFFGKSIDYTVQVDCYGADAAEQSLTVSSLFRSLEASDFFAGYDIQPLWDEDAVYSPLTDGEEQYEERWTIRLHLQYTPIVRTISQFMDTAKIDLVDADKLT